MEKNRLIAANVAPGMADVQEQDYVAMKGQHGLTCWQKITGNAPNEIFEAKSQTLLKKTTHDRKRKASETVKEQRKKRKFTSNDDDINSRRAYSRHDGIIEVDDVHADLPPSDLQDLMACHYRTNVVVTESTANPFNLQQ